EVLQAVHLILAFNIFNVVVGVDARWLERALNEMYARTSPPRQPGGVASKATPASPFQAQNYLEKIFQISYSLGAMNDKTFGQLVGTLVSTRSERDAELKKEKQQKGTKSESDAGSRGASKGDSDGSDNQSGEQAGVGTSNDDKKIDVREELGTL